MRKTRILITAMLCLAVGLTWICYSQTQGHAQDEAKYVGPETCAKCHADVSKAWALTVHRRTLFNDEPSRKGCEACHGPGGEHVAGGGDPTKIVRLSKLRPDQVASVCLKCHTQERVSLWRTSTHSRSKVSCLNCHDPHNPPAGALNKDIEGAKIEIEGLTKSIKAAELAAGTFAVGSKDKDVALEKVAELKAEREKLFQKLKPLETVYERTAEPYLCYGCHKAQKAQVKMASHHPIPENKMNCSGCHNPHGGPNGLLNEESVVETCGKCHAEKIGPFTFEHPPVAEDCTICHNPHGSVQNNLLTQGEPFVCLKCHAGPHSRSNGLGTAKAFAQYYVVCTGCHAEPHGSDEHAALHF